MSWRDRTLRRLSGGLLVRVESGELPKSPHTGSFVIHDPERPGPNFCPTFARRRLLLKDKPGHNTASSHQASSRPKPAGPGGDHGYDRCMRFLARLAPVLIAASIGSVFGVHAGSSEDTTAEPSRTSSAPGGTIRRLATSNFETEGGPSPMEMRSTPSAEPRLAVCSETSRPRGHSGPHSGFG
jgi:hypothetical protein